MANERVEVAIVGSNQTDQAFRDVEANVGRLEGRFTNLNAAIAGFAGGIGAGLVERLAEGVGSAIKFVATAAEDAAVVQRKLEAVLKATGNASGYTADQLDRLAASLARGSSFDDEQFKEATTTILRFGNIAGENLERVLRLSADYAAITGGTLASSAQALARALNDPASGLKRLERNFGDLRPEVEDTIKQLDRAGDRSGAIAMALGELEKKIGGADQGINSGLTGAFVQLKKAIGDLAETVGSSGPMNLLATFINGIAAAIRGLNEALSASNLDKLRMLALVVTNPTAAGQMFVAMGNSPIDVGAPSTAGLGMTDNERMRRMALQQGQEDALRLAREQAKERERIAKELAREQERLRQADIRGWIAHADAVFRAAEENDRALARISEEYWKNEEKLRQEDIAGWIKYADAVFAEADRTNLAIADAAQKAAAEQDKYWQGFLGGIESSFRDVFDSIFQGQISGWRGFVTTLRDIFKRILLDFIYQSLARPLVLNLVASAAGAFGMSGLANAATNSATGVGTNVLGSALGASGFGFATGAEFLSGAMGTFMGPAAPGSAAALGGQFAAFMTNPATLAVLAAVVIAVAVMSRRGGPKEGGSAFGTFDANGNFVPGFAPGTQNGRFYTPSGADPAMVAMTEGIGTAFAETLARLGGTGAGFGFGFGFDRDPRGTANSRVSGVVTNAAGQTILEVINREAGRSDEELQEALELLGRQSLLAALQNSELPEAVRAILNMVDAASATAEQVDAILQLADAFVQFTNATASLDLDAILESGSRSPAESFRLQGQALVELANNTTLTTQSLATLTQATGAYRQSAIQLILSLEEARKTIASMFDQTRRNVLTAGLDNQSLYNFLQDDAATLFDRIMGSSSVEEILRWSNQINQNINQAFGLLSPEQQDAMRQMFLDRINTVDNAVQERLRTLQNNAREEADRQLAEIRRIMTELAEKQNQAAATQQQAATTQQQAADSQLNAANTPRTFNINVDLQNGNTVVTDGG